MALCYWRRQFINKRTFLTTRRDQHGYIVLVPEIGENEPEKNPLFQNNGLPEFNNITIENCRAAIAKQTLDFEAGVSEIEKKIRGKQCSDIFKEVFEPLEQLSTPLEFTWGLSKALYLGNSTLMPTSSYMAIHDRARRARVEKYSNKEIYKAVKANIESKIFKTSEENRILQKFAIEGKLNGLELDKNQFDKLVGRLNNLQKEKSIFKQKTEISTKQFTHVIKDNMATRDFPESVLKFISADPNQPLKGPWTVNLQPHVYPVVLEYCSDRDLRWNVWQALVGRGSNYRDRELTTSLNVEEIRFLRREVANLLNYRNYVDMSMETKMAGSLVEVQRIINILLERAYPAQQEELKELHQFAADRGFQHETLELWDLPYWRRKQRISLYGYDDQKLKQYFPLPRVLDGLFQLCEKLFNIRIKQRSDVSAWHKDVKFYDIFENHSSAPVAGFYLDPYQQKVKLTNRGWMVGIQNKSVIMDKKPLAALIFNFDPPTVEKPSCLTVKEIEMIFQKFGHAMQHLLTRTNYSEVAGLSNIEWDAVGICGHVFSHWMLNKDVIDSISSHCDSEDKLPQQMYESLVKTHKHLAGLDLCRELYLSALDLELHSTKDFWLDIIKRLWPQYRCFTLHKIDSHPLSFTQIISDEWGAAYYSNLWSRMIAADIYSAFHEVLDDEQQMLDIGKRYRDTLLALGGSVHPGQVFREFRGRDPSPKALLRSLGIRKLSESNSQ